MKQDVVTKILWKMNRSGLWIWLAIIGFNMVISLIVPLFERNEFAFGRYISIMLINLSIMIISTLISLTAVMASQGLDYMITLYVERNVIFKSIMKNIWILIGLLMMILTVALGLNLNYGYTSMDNVFIFGIRGMNINGLSYILIFIYFSILGFLTVGYIMFITLLGKRFGWRYLVGTIFLTLAVAILGFNGILMFFMAGTQMPLVFGALLAIGILFTIVNGQLIKKVEVKG